MSDKVSFQIEGLQEIDEILKELDQKETSALYISAMRKGGSVMQKALRANATIKGVKASIKADRKNGLIDVGIQATKETEPGKNINIAYIVRFLEYGTKTRVTRERKANRGIIGTEKAFVQRTMDQEMPNVIKVFQEEWGALIDKAIERKNKAITKKLDL